MVVAATGGTPRHSMVLDHALRPLFAHLRAVVAPTGVFAATDDCLGISAAADLLGSRDAINVLVASYEERKALDDEVAAAVFPPKTDG